MLTLNGKRFYNRKDEPADITGYTGSYSVNTRTISLYDADGIKRGIINPFGILASARKLDDGRWWYSYMIPLMIGEYSNRQQYGAEMAAAVKLILDNKRMLTHEAIKASSV